MSRSFLGLTDWKVNANLFANRDETVPVPQQTSISTLKKQDDMILLQVENLLSTAECNVIAQFIATQPLEPMGKKYPADIRNNSRLLVFDEATSEMMWGRLGQLLTRETNLEPNGTESTQPCSPDSNATTAATPIAIPTTPLGFGVRGQWDLACLNPALRLNAYKPGEIFTMHKDSQYAAHGDERSVLSLIVYLTDGFEGGETEFYFPPTASCDSDGTMAMTTTEEIAANGGLGYYHRETVAPKRGRALLFSHNLLHCSLSHKAVPKDTVANGETCAESNSLTDLTTNTSDPTETALTQAGAKKKNNKKKKWVRPAEPVDVELLSPSVCTRLVMRSDVVVRRLVPQPQGFSISLEEQSDYHLALQYFRDAQRAEMENSEENKTLADDLYQRSLAIRFLYPRKLKNMVSAPVDRNSFPAAHPINFFPDDVWVKIFCFLPEKEVYNTIFAFPCLFRIKALWRMQQPRIIRKERQHYHRFIPRLVSQSGISTHLRFHGDIFRKDQNAALRVAAAYTFFLLGHRDEAESYIVRYNEQTQEVTEVEMESLLYDVYHNRNAFGSIYRVALGDSAEKIGVMVPEPEPIPLRDPETNEILYYDNGDVMLGQPEKEALVQAARDPLADFTRSVDRAYMTTRHGAQFLGTDFNRESFLNLTEYIEPFPEPEAEIETLQEEEIPEENSLVPEQLNASVSEDAENETEQPEPFLSEWHEERSDVPEPEKDESADSYDYDYAHAQRYYDEFWQPSALALLTKDIDSSIAGIRTFACCPFSTNRHHGAISTDYLNARDSFSFYAQSLKRPIAGCSVHNFAQAKDFLVDSLCTCSRVVSYFLDMKRSVNMLLFDFENFGIEIRDYESSEQDYFYYRNKSAKRYKADITPLLKGVGGGFNHASCQCYYPDLKVDAFKALSYTELKHVVLEVLPPDEDDEVLVEATYSGISCL